MNWPIQVKRDIPIFRLAAILQSTLASIPATAHEYMAGPIMIGHPWARATSSATPVAGGYLVLKNTGNEPDVLLSGSSPIAAIVEIHESTIVDGIAKMRRVDGGIEVKPGETVTLKAEGRISCSLSPQSARSDFGPPSDWLVLAFRRFASRVTADPSLPERPEAKPCRVGAGACISKRAESGL